MLSFCERCGATIQGNGEKYCSHCEEINALKKKIEDQSRELHRLQSKNMVHLNRDLWQLILNRLDENWLTIFRHAGGCWDSLDSIEEILGLVNNTTDTIENKRLVDKYKRYISNRALNTRELRDKMVVEICKQIELCDPVDANGHKFTMNNTYLVLKEVVDRKILVDGRRA